MSTITPSRLDKLLEGMQEQFPDQWHWKRDNSDQFWVIFYEASIPPFKFYVNFNNEILYAQYVLEDFKIKADCWLALYRVLLRLNEELSLVKFGLTSRNYISLSGEIPAAQLSHETFQNLLQLMVYYLEQLYWEIEVVAQSPELAPFLTGREDFLAAIEQGMSNLISPIKVEDLSRG